MAADVVGPYRILEPLGKGGMGTVFRARHRETRAAVALKVVAATAPALLHGIRRESHALLGIRHEGIVRVVDEGVHEGLPWYAMEIIEGRTLRAVARDFWQGAAPLHGSSTEALDVEPETRTFDRVVRASADTAAIMPAGEALRAAANARLRDVLDLVQRMCAPLAYLHGEGIVHRDLKPENVIVRADGTPVLVDFGLVSRFGADVSRESFEVAGKIAGTAAYMSPQQATGEMVDARSDLYSLGVILYELLTGRLPFAGSPYEVLSQHVHAAPVPPSALVTGMAPELDALVLRLLCKSPRDRLGHADVLAALLAELGAGEAPVVPGTRVPL